MGLRTPASFGKYPDGLVPSDMSAHGASGTSGKRFPNKGGDPVQKMRLLDLVRSVTAILLFFR